MGRSDAQFRVNFLLNLSWDPKRYSLKARVSATARTCCQVSGGLSVGYGVSRAVGVGGEAYGEKSNCFKTFSPVSWINRY